MNTPRSLLCIDPLPVQRHGDRLATRDIQWSPLTPDLDPFIAVSLYDMTGPTFPPHPHAGFMVATYIVPESPLGFVNQDSLGTRNRIAPGALHVTVAGRGVLHEEQPEASGQPARGFQIWIDLPDEVREMAPQALHLASDAVPRLDLPGAEVRVVLGESEGVHAPLGLPTAVSLIDVALDAQGSWSHRLPAAHHAFVFVFEGAVAVNGHRAPAGCVVRTRPDGDLLRFEAAGPGARFTVFAGRPLRQTPLVHGPFVARDPDQIARFTRDHARGAFGALVPLSRGRT
ncbi:MAG: pirin family protein [Burkholderiales bacterium]|nr:MAG: pirin family protein [Burkholderiales bacterium]